MRIAGAALSFASGGCLVMALAVGGEDGPAIAADPSIAEPTGAALQLVQVIPEPAVEDTLEDLPAAEEAIPALT